MAVGGIGLWGLLGYRRSYYFFQLLLHFPEVIPYILLVCSLPYWLDLRDLDIIYVAIYPTSVSRVLVNRSALGKYLCRYKRVPSGLIAGIFVSEGQVIVPYILLVGMVSLYS